MQLSIYDCGVEGLIALPTKKEQGSQELFSEDTVKSMNEHFLIVRPLRSRCIVGQLNIARYLLNAENPLKEKKREEFSESDMKKYKRYQELKRINASFNTFLPTDVYKRLNHIRNEVRSMYTRCCVNPYLPYMEQVVYKTEFAPYVKGKFEELKEILSEVETNWERIIEEFKSSLLLAIPDLSEEDVRDILFDLPSKNEFVTSYNNVFLFEVDTFSKKKNRINFMDSEVKSAQEIAMDDLKKIIKDALIELIEKCDRFITSAKEGTVRPRTRGMFNELSANLSFKTAFLGNESVKEIVQTLSDMQDCSVDQCCEACDEAVVAAYKFLSESHLLERSDLRSLKSYSNQLLKSLI